MIELILSLVFLTIVGSYCYVQYMKGKGDV